MPDIDVPNMVAEQIQRIKREHDRAYQSALRDNMSHQWSYVHGLGYALAVLGVSLDYAADSPTLRCPPQIGCLAKKPT